MLIPSFTEKLCKISRLMKKNGTVPLALTIIMALTMNPDAVYAGNFWDKIKDAAKKSQQQQQQRQEANKNNGGAVSQTANRSNNFRRNPSLKTFKVQGVSLGMSREESRKALTAKGYGSTRGYVIETEQTRKSVSLEIIGKPDKTDLVVGIGYSQYIYPKKAKFDKNAIYNAIIKKYGKPNYERTTNVGIINLFYIEMENAPTQKDVVLACKKEVSKNKSLSATQVLSISTNATSRSHWVNSGNAKVRETCPSAVKIFDSMVEAGLAPDMRVEIVPYKNSFSIILKWQGAKQRILRQANIDYQKKVNSAPAIQLDI